MKQLEALGRRGSRIGNINQVTKGLDFKGIGVSPNEDKIGIDNQDSARQSIESHYSEEVGVFAGLLSAKAVATRGADVTRIAPTRAQRAGSSGTLEPY